MKIIIHSIEELLQLTELIRPPQVTNVANIDVKSSGVAEALARDVKATYGKLDVPDGLPDDICAPVAHVYDAMGDRPTGGVPAVAATPEMAEAIEPERDADGATYSTDWHSDPKKLNADGRWRARRKRDEDAYAVWLLEQAVVEADEEPVATETHALPQVAAETAGDTPDVQVEPETAGQAAPAQAASTVDLVALVAASQKAAMDAKDGLQDLLVTCREFTSAHGTAEFNALKAAVAPRGDTGASLQEFTPAERRLMLACVANYPKKEA